MSKGRRKPSQSQRDKIAIAIAKHLKKKGILSKQTKLHGGRFISKEVLRKVRQYEGSFYAGYSAIKAPKALVKEAQKRGYQTVRGTHIVGPASHEFRSRIKKELITGVKPVRGGMMEQVVHATGEMNIRKLFSELERSGIDDLKNNNELFAFTYNGHMSFRGFRDSQQIWDYLQFYEGIGDENFDLQDFVIFRLHSSDQERFIKGPKDREEARRQRRKERISATGRTMRRTLADKVADMHPTRAKIFMEKRARLDREKRERIKSDPKAYEAFKRKEKERVKKWRERQKNKKK